ncbi:MAG: acyl transferase [Bacteroidetes bacterium]|nr:acyl transferase [Bacteroidota bacterium]
MNKTDFVNKIFSLKKSDSDFEALALQVFAYQFQSVSVYNQFCSHLGRTPENVNSISNIPFMPIQFFKKHELVDQNPVQKTFLSSGTGDYNQRSKHMVADLNVYNQSAQKAFAHFFGSEPIKILALLPNYLEQGDSSLVYMVNQFLYQPHCSGSFYGADYEQLNADLKIAIKNGERVLLWGVTYALLEFAAQFPQDLCGHFVLETGGMKGRRRELTRVEVHAELTSAFNLENVWSEYGMTELLSQAYSKGDGIFNTPPWMKILLTDINDPLGIKSHGKSGRINVIDLANIHSCSFIATDDLGWLKSDGSFGVIGRIDGSQTRGCNLLRL